MIGNPKCFVDTQSCQEYALYIFRKWFSAFHELSTLISTFTAQRVNDCHKVNLSLWFVINFDFCFKLKFILVIYRGNRSILTKWNVLIYSLPNVLIDFCLKPFSLLLLLKAKINLCPLMFYFLLYLTYSPNLLLKVISFCEVLYFLMSVKKYFWEITELLYLYSFEYSKML